MEIGVLRISVKSEENERFGRRAGMVLEHLFQKTVYEIKTFVCKCQCVDHDAVYTDTYEHRPIRSIVEHCCFYRWLILFVWFNYCVECLWRRSSLSNIFWDEIRRWARVYEKGKTSRSEWLWKTLFLFIRQNESANATAFWIRNINSETMASIQWEMFDEVSDFSRLWFIGRSVERSIS